MQNKATAAARKGQITLTAKAAAAIKSAASKAAAKAAPAAAKAAKSAAKAAPAAKAVSGAKAAPAAKAVSGAKAAPAAKTPAKPAAGDSPSEPTTAPRTGTVTRPQAARPAKEVPEKVATKKAEAPAPKKGPAKAKAKPNADRVEFFAQQRQLLLEERQSYTTSAEALQAQADSLALEHEPGDVQFDEEGGEGGTANVDREIDLYLSAQARATVAEIDRALEKLDEGSYGMCEHCGEPIPDARLQALPYAALCVACKSGGLSSRR